MNTAINTALFAFLVAAMAYVGPALDEADRLADQPAPADTVSATLACSAIRAIPAHRFTPAVAAAVLAALNARLDALPLKSSDVIGAVERIDDAIYFLEDAT